MRLVIAALAGFAIAVVPALAADHSVTSVAGNQWSPATLTIAKGDKVVWTNGEGGFHNVSFDDNSYTQPPAPSSTWPSEVSRTFGTPGTYTYVCDAHSNMKGTITVNDAGTTGTGTTTQTTGTTTQPTETTQTTTTQSSPPPPVVSVKPLRSRFCVRSGRICSSAGVYLRITSDTPHRGKARLRRNGKAFGSVSFDLPAGTKYVRFRRTSAGRRIIRGRYTLKLGTAPTVRFRVI